MFTDYIYAIIIYPLEMFIESVFSVAMNMIGNAGYAIIFVSIAVQLLALPLYKRADEIQEKEREKQKELSGWITRIKKTFKGDEQLMVLSEYYRQNDYQPWYSLRGMLPLLLQIPFFIAAYHFLSNCGTLNGAAFYFMKDMGAPDGMLVIHGISINVLPILMTVINIVSGMIYTKDLSMKDRLQLFITAGVFLVLLYDSPAGLVFYWTLNNVFSLMKNVFMKLVKHPRELLCIISVLFAGAVDMKCYLSGAWQKDNGILVMAIVFILGLLPACGLVADRISKACGRDETVSEPVSGTEKTIFRVCMLTLSVLLGLMIPVSTMSSSPAEFVIRGHYVSPLVQLIYTFCVSAGLFLLWGNLFFSFMSERAQRILLFAAASGTVCALMDFLFFRQHLQNMSLHMQYYDTFIYSTREILINAAAAASVCIVILCLIRINKRILMGINIILLVSAVFMSVYLMINVQAAIDGTSHLKDDEYYTESDVHICLDRKGKNVVLFMLDRAFGQFVPYLINEKPEIKSSFSGFTFYPNTISYGTHTSTGAPALFGGYDYTALNMKKRSGSDTEDLHNESLKVLPALFSENGYKCTVLDPPYYIDLGKGTLEDFYHEIDPQIKAYYADGVVKTKEEAAGDFEYFAYAARKNYIRHSIFIASPLLFRSFLYDNDAYLMQEKIDDRIMYAGHMEELDKLGDMTRITEGGDDTFTIIDNDLTHSINTDLQLPDYTLEDRADNSAYMTKWKDGLAKTDEETGRDINMYTDTQIQAYQVNMAAFLSIGRWLDRLKESGLYDNTRIIIVADHGYSYFAFDDMIFEKGETVTDLGMFTPLLMVKDFGDGEFSVSDDFMTNADAPAFAVRDLITDPVNPYTGNTINSDPKKGGPQYVLEGKQWYSIHDDIYDMSNWDLADLNEAGE